MPYEIWQAVVYEQLRAVKVQLDQGKLQSIYRETGAAVLAVYEAADAREVDQLIAGMPIFRFAEQVTVRALWDLVPALPAYADPPAAPAEQNDDPSDTPRPDLVVEEARIPAVEEAPTAELTASPALATEGEAEGAALAGAASATELFEQDAVQRLQRIENLLTSLVREDEGRDRGFEVEVEATDMHRSAEALSTQAPPARSRGVEIACASLPGEIP